MRFFEPIRARPLGSALQPAVTAIAVDALVVGEGGKLPTNSTYLDRMGIGAGTVQRALKELRECHALTVVSRGHLGRVVDHLDIAAAWRAAWLPPVRLALPPAGPVEILALQQVLAEALSAIGILHTVTHIRGGSTRLAMAMGGEADMALASAGVLTIAPPPHRYRRLGKGTYYGPDRIAVVTRADATQPPQRIAIDPDSPDHQLLTHGQFPPGPSIQYVPVPFPRVPATVLSGTADAGIWHITPSVVPLALTGLKLHPLTMPAARHAWDLLSEAVLVGGPHRPELSAVLAALNFDSLIERQAAVIQADSGLVPI